MKEKRMENIPAAAAEEVPLKTGTSKTFVSVIVFLFIVLALAIGALWHQLKPSDRFSFRTKNSPGKNEH
jgi:hypothetical protein